MEDNQNNLLQCQCQISQNDPTNIQNLELTDNNNVKIVKYGLYIENERYQNQKLLLPIKDIKFSTKITNNISNTTITYTYQNPYNKHINAEYVMPVSINATFISFQAQFNGKTIIGVIKEKEEAIKEYKRHKKQGNTVALAQTNEESQEIIKTSLANIQPQTEVKIIFVYTEELECQGNKFWKFSIPSKISPNPCGFTSQSNTNNHQPCQTSIEITIKSDTEIEFLRSSTHQLQNYQENMNKTEINTSIQNIQFNRDFVLLYKDQGISKPSVLLSKNDIQACAQVNFVPDFNNLQVDDAFKQQITDNGTFQVDMNQAKGEFIFLLDRSSSMSGSNIESAKKALIVFLKSLPPNSYFNVFSFGSGFEPLFKKGSVYYKKNTLDQAISQIEFFMADFGGTNITDLLITIFAEEKMKNMPRQVFLLTDGEVWQTSQPLQLIKNQAKHTRFHTIGIGSECSEYLVKQAAINGKGKSIFIKNNEDVAGDIIDLLDYSLTPCLDSFKIKYDQDLIDYMVPNPENIPLITKNQPFTSYIFFKPGIQLEDINTKIELEYFDSSLDKNLNYTLDINPNTCKQDPYIFKMGIFRVIQALQNHLDSPDRDQSFQKKMKQFKDNQRLSIKDQRIQLLSKISKPKCPNGHQYDKILRNDKKLKTLICDLCEINCYKNNCASNNCNYCDYNICDKCLQNLHKLCNQGHQLKYYFINSQKINYLQCDMCNYSCYQLGVGTNICEQCDFNICQNCHKEEEKLIQKSFFNVKGYKIQTDLSNKDEENNLECLIQFDDIYFAKIISTQEEIKNLSIQNQILSTQTAFICVIDVKNQSIGQRIKNAFIDLFSSNKNEYCLESFSNNQIQKYLEQESSSQSNQNCNNNPSDSSDRDNQSEQDQENLGKLYYNFNFQTESNRKKLYHCISEEELENSNNQSKLQQSDNRSALQQEQDNSIDQSLQNQQQQNHNKEEINQQLDQNVQDAIQKSGQNFQELQYQEIENNCIDDLNSQPQKPKQSQIPNNYNNPFIKYEYSKQVQQHQTLKYFQPIQISKSKSYSKEDLLNIIKLQEIEGYWKFSNQLCYNTIGLTQKQLDIQQQDINTLSQDLWITMLIVEWIKKYFQDQKSIWQLINRKTQDWIKQNFKQNNINQSQYEYNIQTLLQQL